MLHGCRLVYASSVKIAYGRRLGGPLLNRQRKVNDVAFDNAFVMLREVMAVVVGDNREGDTIAVDDTRRNGSFAVGRPDGTRYCPIFRFKIHRDFGAAAATGLYFGRPLAADVPCRETRSRQAGH